MSEKRGIAEKFKRASFSGIERQILNGASDFKISVNEAEKLVQIAADFSDIIDKE